METKVCSECSEEKPVSEFSWRKDQHRYRTQCKKCRNSYFKKYNDTNKARRKELVDKEHKSRVFKKWYSRNKDKRSKDYREWAAKNPDKVRERDARRKARKKNVTVEYVCYETVRQRDDTCYLCGKTFTDEERWDGSLTHVDHKVPLSRLDLNPTHSYDNCALTHAKCNLQKSDKTPEEYLG